uniref:Uncharacterized protein n=1 Tax=Globodera pallida TaxID=36090 RepID=A0A183CIM6_GLOPA
MILFQQVRLGPTKNEEAPAAALDEPGASCNSCYVRSRVWRTTISGNGGCATTVVVIAVQFLAMHGGLPFNLSITTKQFSNKHTITNLMLREVTPSAASAEQKPDLIDLRLEDNDDNDDKRRSEISERNDAQDDVSNDDDDSD